MKIFIFFIAVMLGFLISFKFHVTVVMYPLSAIIFYFYIPYLYALSRVNVLKHDQETEILHLKFYPMELLLWLVACSFFAFIIAHLLADLLFHMPHLHHFMFILMMGYLTMIINRELKAKKLHGLSKKDNFVKQGRLLSFEMLFAYLIILSIPH